MEIIDNAKSQDVLVNYLTNSIKMLISKPPYDKFKIIHEFINIAESYFSNIKKSGKIKKNTIAPIIVQFLGLPLDDVNNFIEYVCNSKLIKKDYLKVSKFIRRCRLKRKIKKTLLNK